VKKTFVLLIMNGITAVVVLPAIHVLSMQTVAEFHRRCSKVVAIGLGALLFICAALRLVVHALLARLVSTLVADSNYFSVP
jgi:hypothetical protein